MPVQLTVVIQDDAGFDVVADEAIRQWLAFHVRRTDTQIALAQRAGMSYRQLRHFMAKLRLTMSDVIALKDPIDVETTVRADEVSEQTLVPEPCQFCGSLDKVHMHHVVNRYDSPVMVALCSKCHRKFHFLNKLYRPPERIPSRRQPLTEERKRKEIQ